jgi:hypothetical protein
MVWAVVFSWICMVLYTPGMGSTPPNDVASTKTLTLAEPDAGAKVLGLVHASGLPAPTLTPLHGPVLIITEQVEATWPKRRVTELEAVMTDPSGALRVNQTGEEDWEKLSEGRRRKSATKTSVESLRMKPAFLKVSDNQKGQKARHVSRHNSEDPCNRQGSIIVTVLRG